MMLGSAYTTQNSTSDEGPSLDRHEVTSNCSVPVPASSKTNGAVCAYEKKINSGGSVQCCSSLMEKDETEGRRSGKVDDYGSNVSISSSTSGVKREREILEERSSSREHEQKRAPTSTFTSFSYSDVQISLPSKVPVGPGYFRSENKGKSAVILSPPTPCSPVRLFATEGTRVMELSKVVHAQLNLPIQSKEVAGRSSFHSQRGNSSLSSSLSPSPPSTSTKLPQQKATARGVKWGGLLLPYFLDERHESQREVLMELCQRIAVAVPGDKMEARDRFMTLMASLKDPLNVELREKLVSGKLPVEVLVTLSEKELANPERRREMDEGFKKRSKDTNLQEIANALKTTSTLFSCPSCKARDCSWVQRQTRSGDEPMTVICSCNRCNHQWRKY